MALDLFSNVFVYAGTFVLVLSLVVFVHEFGHFQAARWSGVAIDTFSIGFGRALAAWKDRQGVEWKVGMLPLGGYVKFTGDANAASAGGLETYESAESIAQARAKGLFQAMPVATRSFVVAAGPLANFIFSILAFGLLFFIVGKDVTDNRALSARVDVIAPNSAAAEAGFEVGDVVSRIDGRSVSTFGEMREIVENSAGRALAVELVRNSQIVRLTATPRLDETLNETGATVRRGLLGLQRIPDADERVIDKLNPLEAIGAGAAQTWRIVANTVGYIANIFSGRASAEHLAGPAGILDMSGQVAKASWGADEAGLGERLGKLALALLGWAATLSVAIGFVNLLPIPVLDGGHLVMYAAEAVRGRPLSARIQEWGFRAGFAVIISLFLFASWNDLQRFLERAGG